MTYRWVPMRNPRRSSFAGPRVQMNHINPTPQERPARQLTLDPGSATATSGRRPATHTARNIPPTRAAAVLRESRWFSELARSLVALHEPGPFGGLHAGSATFGRTSV